MMIKAAVLAAAAAVARSRNVSVEWHAPFFSGGGYCSEASTFVTALEEAGVEVSIAQHGDSYSASYVAGQRGSAAFEKVVALSGKRRRRDVDVVVCHSEPGAWHVLDGPSWPSSPCPDSRRAVVVGRTMFETDRLPRGWASRLNAVDEVWVPTEFHRAIFEEGGARRVAVVGEPVDVDAFRPEGPVLDELRAAFVAVSVFKWEKRKGWDVLLRAWREACRPEDLLVLVTGAYHSDADFHAKLDRFARDTFGEPIPCPIRVLSDLSHTDLAALYRTADVLLAPTRGEGWGRPHVEAMASATPIIATNWSGPTAYLTEDNGYPLRVAPNLSPVAEGPFADHLWAEPDVDHLAALIRRARDFPDERKAKGLRARADMVDRFSPAALAQVVRARLRDILLRLRGGDQDRRAREDL